MHSTHHLKDVSNLHNQSSTNQNQNHSYSLLLNIKQYSKSITKLAIGCIKKQNLLSQKRQSQQLLSSKLNSIDCPKNQNAKQQYITNKSYSLNHLIENVPKTKKKKYDYGIVTENQQTLDSKTNCYNLRANYSQIQNEPFVHKNIPEQIQKSSNKQKNKSISFIKQSQKHYSTSPFQINQKQLSMQRKIPGKNYTKQQRQNVLNRLKQKKKQTEYHSFKQLNSTYKKNQQLLAQQKSFLQLDKQTKRHINQSKKKIDSTKNKINEILNNIDDLDDKKKHKKSLLQEKFFTKNRSPSQNNLKTKHSKQSLCLKYYSKSFINTNHIQSMDLNRSNNDEQKIQRRRSNQKAKQNQRFQKITFNQNNRQVSNNKQKPSKQTRLNRNNPNHKDSKSKLLYQKPTILYPKTQTYTSRSEYNIDRLSNKLDCYIKEHINNRQR